MFSKYIRVLTYGGLGFVAACGSEAQTRCQIAREAQAQARRRNSRAHDEQGLEGQLVDGCVCDQEVLCRRGRSRCSGVFALEVHLSDARGARG